MFILDIKLYWNKLVKMMVMSSFNTKKNQVSILIKCQDKLMGSL